ncbi:MAG: hypothetical protein D6B28_00945 [Gammaproteobacteria bacterium]|nr:MAG: hypothetical protein D6B28_00945 [Gammaproteobacteria bacterium]
MDKKFSFVIATPLKDSRTKVGLDIGHALARDGHKVRYFDYDKRPFPLNLYPKPLRNENYENKYHYAVNQTLISGCRKYKPDFLLIVKGVQIYPETIKLISSMGVTTVGYWIDDPLDHERSMVNAPSYDIYLTNCSKTLGSYKEQGLTNVHHLPSAVNTAHFSRTKVRKRYDISFLGTHSAYREEMLSQLEVNGLHIFGPGWQKNSSISQWHKNDNIDSVQLHPGAFGRHTNLVFNQSKVNLNIHNWFGKGHAMNLRLYEVPAAGGFLLTDWVEEIDKYFEQDKHVVCFKSVEEMNEKAKFYVNNDQARNTIADAGYEHVLKHHSYDARIRDLINIITG